MQRNQGKFSKNNAVKYCFSTYLNSACDFLDLST
jgi:hypothetical protein